jgi:hypothetical protein
MKLNMTKSIIQWAVAVLLLRPAEPFGPGVLWVVTTPDPSAVLDMQSTDKGFLWPRLSTSERNAISSPATGLIIFNTNTLCIEINLGTPAAPQWEQVQCRTGIISSLNCAGASVTGLTINIPYTGGNGGVYDAQSAASTGITGLSATLPPGTMPMALAACRGWYRAFHRVPEQPPSVCLQAVLTAVCRSPWWQAPFRHSIARVQL